MAQSKILYCRCAYANVVPGDVKNDVLKGLCERGVSFESVPDLCEMSARKDPRLESLLEGDSVKIAACYRRAVKWLFHSAGVPFPEDEEKVEVHNMREESAEDILGNLTED